MTGGEIGLQLQGAAERLRGMGGPPLQDQHVREVHKQLGMIGRPAQSLAVRPLGFARPAALLEDQPQVIVGRGVLGLELRGPPRRRFGLVQPIEVQEHGGEVDVRPRVVRLGRDGPAEGADGLLGPRQQGQDLAQVIEDVGGIGPEPERLVIPGLRLGESALLTERVSPPATAFERRPRDGKVRDISLLSTRSLEVPGGLGMAGLELQDAKEARLGLLVPAQAAQGHAEQVPGVRVLRPEPDRLAERRDRLVEPAGRLADGAEQVPAVSAGRVHSQGGAVDLLRPGEIARLVEGFALRQRLSDIHQRGPFRAQPASLLGLLRVFALALDHREAGVFPRGLHRPGPEGLAFANGAAHVWLLDRGKGAVVLDDGRRTGWPQLRQPKSIRDRERERTTRARSRQSLARGGVEKRTPLSASRPCDDRWLRELTGRIRSIVRILSSHEPLRADL